MILTIRISIDDIFDQIIEAATLAAMELDPGGSGLAMRLTDKAFDALAKHNMDDEIVLNIDTDLGTVAIA